MENLSFFSIDVAIKLNKERASVLNKAKAYPANRIPSKEKLLEIAEDITKDFWRDHVFKFNSEEFKPDSGKKTIHPDEADLYLGTSPARAYTHRNLNYASYRLPISFDSDFYRYASIGNGFKQLGELDKFAVATIYFFTENELTQEEIKQIKAKKEEFIAKIDKVVTENNNIFEQSKSEVFNEVVKILNQAFDDEDRRKDINSQL